TQNPRVATRRSGVASRPAAVGAAQTTDCVTPRPVWKTRSTASVSQRAERVSRTAVGVTQFGRLLCAPARCVSQSARAASQSARVVLQSAAATTQPASERRETRRASARINAMRASPEQRYAAVVEALHGAPGVTVNAGRGFGSGALKVEGKIFAMLSSKAQFVVK